MIAYPDLGKLGRLGNHLFQIAATVGAALDHGDIYGFPRWQYEGAFPISGLGCFYDLLPAGPVYREKRFAYDQIPYEPNLRLYGFFQSERYFKRHADFIRKLLTPPGVPTRDGYDGVASLQVRRGDYFNFPDHHPILPMGYYRSAQDYLRTKGVKKFLVMSDDLAWCRDHFTASDEQVILPLDPIDQFRLTLACEHHIMANSTFSWWTAWLDPNPEKVVIAPKLWFGPGYAHYGTEDLYAKGWVVL